MERRIKYPIDRASFKDIREEGYLYVDKTAFVYKLASLGKYYFLARPRRFGKSLFLDTLAQYFRGNRLLFKGLVIDYLQPNEWQSYPVLRFNLSTRSYSDKDSVSMELKFQLELLEKEYNVASYQYPEDIYGRFHNLILSIKNQVEKNVVILIDEYDAPISSTIDRPELQEIYRDQLQGFYSVLKKAEESIRFCMLTGVTRFGKVSVFSGLNNLKDITFSDEYATICGITKEELFNNYGEGIEAIAGKEGLTTGEVIELLKYNYDGYHFSASLTDIYNPFSLNNAFYDCVIEDYWCQSGVPTLLAKSLMQNDYDIERLTDIMVRESELRDLSMYTANPIPLFYQTGYLTLKNYDKRRKLFGLGYPNREVEVGILRNILNFYNPGKRDRQSTVFELENAFEEGNPEKVVKILSSFLFDIPLDLRKDVKKYENYYHTIFYCLVKLIGLDIHAEYATSEGYIDILVKTEYYIYVVELKVNGTAKDAITQIVEKHYCAPFETDSRKLFKIGLGFSKDSGTINSFIIA